MGDKPYIYVVDFYNILKEFCKSFFQRHEKGFYKDFYEMDYNFRTDEEVLMSFEELKNKAMLKLIITDTCVPNNGGFKLTKKLRRKGYKGGIILGGVVVYDKNDKIVGAYDRKGDEIPYGEIIDMGVDEVIGTPLENHEFRFSRALRKCLIDITPSQPS